MLDVKAIKEAVGELDEDAVAALLKEFIESKPSGEDAQAVVAACQQGMEIVGDKFNTGEYFVGDLIFAGELLSSCIDTLKPLIGGETGGDKGTIVLGTVEGDIHDIGKDIFLSMSEATGFTVVDLGIDKPPNAFVEAVSNYKPQKVGFSGVLTLSIDAMKRTVEALKAEGLRDSVKIIIGGNAVNEESCKYIGADAWSKNAAEAAKICGEWV